MICTKEITISQFGTFEAKNKNKQTKNTNNVLPGQEEEILLKCSSS